jgi:hypothetical protein
MLRVLVAVLLGANLVFWAWRSGALDGLGLGPAQERDPARLLLQVQPESVRVVPGPAVAAAAAPSPGPAASAVAAAPGALCLESGPIPASALEAAERTLAAALPEGAWQRSSQDIAAAYAVVLGPFNSADSLKKKSEEIARLRIPTEAIDLPAEAGTAQGSAVLALGRYDSRAGADAALAAYVQRGVRTGRVATLKPAQTETRLRVSAASTAQAEQLRAFKDPAFEACAPAPALATR